MIELPRIGSAVMLRDRGGAVFASRIESFDRAALTVVKPVGVPAAYPYPPGSRFDVLWTAPSGQHVLPAELHRSRAEGTVLLWELRPVAAPVIEQRREFVRVPAFGRVVLWLDRDDRAGDGAADGFVDGFSDEAGGRGSGAGLGGGLEGAGAGDEAGSWGWRGGDSGGDLADDRGSDRGAPGLMRIGADTARREGYLIDVSEAAMQASIWAEPDDPLLAEAGRGIVEFSAHGTSFTRAGVVHGVRPGAVGHEMTVIFRFDQSGAEATELRREVFAAQVDLRQRWRREADSPADV